MNTVTNAIPLCFVTNNAGKLKEIQALLGDTFDLKSLADIGCVEDIPETSDTIEGNSMLKARHVWEGYGVNCFADDTGLEVEALGGAPGVYSARYAGEACNADDNMNLLLHNLQGNTQRSAQFKTVITLVMNGEYRQFEGVAKGQIIEEKRGSKGFGYDPIFVPEGYERTFAELSMEEKNQISHRAKAVKALVDYLKAK